MSAAQNQLNDSVDRLLPAQILQALHDGADPYEGDSFGLTSIDVATLQNAPQACAYERLLRNDAAVRMLGGQSAASAQLRQAVEQMGASPIQATSNLSAIEEVGLRVVLRLHAQLGKFESLTTRAATYGVDLTPQAVDDIGHTTRGLHHLAMSIQQSAAWQHIVARNGTTYMEQAIAHAQDTGAQDGHHTAELYGIDGQGRIWPNQQGFVRTPPNAHVAPSFDPKHNNQLQQELDRVPSVTTPLPLQPPTSPQQIHHPTTVTLQQKAAAAHTVVVAPPPAPPRELVYEQDRVSFAKENQHHVAPQTPSSPVVPPPNPVVLDPASPAYRQVPQLNAQRLTQWRRQRQATPDPHHPDVANPAIP